MSENSADQPVSKKSLLKVFVVTLIVIVVIIAIILGVKMIAAHNKAASARPLSPQVVTASKATKTNWQPFIEATGYTESIQGVDVTAQVSGIVTKIYFKSGGSVKKGDILFKLDYSDLTAQLYIDKATTEYQKLTYERQKKLYQDQASSQQTTDEAYASYQEAIGAERLTEANIDFHIIRAPFSGKLGVRLIDLGEYFDAGTAAVALNQLSPLYVNFNLVESDINKVRLGQEISIKSTAFPGKKFKGKVTSMNPKLAEDTRSLLVQATIPNNNSDDLFLPGMLTSVDLLLPEKKSIVTILGTAINYTLYGDTVFKLVKSKEYYNNKPVYIAHKYAIRVGERNGLSVEVISGVSVDELVATSGQLKLNDGIKVTINSGVDLTNSNLTKSSLLVDDATKKTSKIKQSNSNGD
jgi:membrane fusion protein (multidrug efflux system)